MPVSTLHASPRDDARKTRGQDGFVTYFPSTSCVPYNIPVYPGALRFARDSGLSSRVLPLSPMLSPASYFMLKPCWQASTVSTPRLAFLKTNGSWTSFVDDVKRCFRGSAETAEAGCGDYLANPFFA